MLSRKATAYIADVIICGSRNYFFTAGSAGTVTDDRVGRSTVEISLPPRLSWCTAWSAFRRAEILEQLAKLWNILGTKPWFLGVFFSAFQK